MCAILLAKCRTRSRRCIKVRTTYRTLVPGVGTDTRVGAFRSYAPRLFGAASRCLFVRPFQLLPSRGLWRRISFAWPFPHRHRRARWLIDVTELFVRFCCWTLILLLCHLAWLRRGYRRSRNLIDWLIVHAIAGIIWKRSSTHIILSIQRNSIQRIYNVDKWMKTRSFLLQQVKVFSAVCSLIRTPRLMFISTAYPCCWINYCSHFLLQATSIGSLHIQCNRSKKHTHSGVMQPACVR